MSSAMDLMQTLALRHPKVEQGIACEGTAVESRTYKINKKAFLFARPKAIMVKLRESLPEAVELAAKEPKRFKAKAGVENWVTIQLDAGPVPPRPLLARWVAESYGLMAARKR
jgi:hypothetical protein